MFYKAWEVYTYHVQNTYSVTRFIQFVCNLVDITRTKTHNRMQFNA